MYTIFFTAIIAFFHLERALADDGATCSQSRLPASPKAIELAHFVHQKTFTTCNELESKDGLTVEFEGYNLSRNISHGSSEACQHALSRIAVLCITKATFYGGEFAYQGQLFNLSNERYPGSPIPLHSSSHSVEEPSSLPSRRVSSSHVRQSHASVHDVRPSSSRPQDSTRPLINVTPAAKLPHTGQQTASVTNVCDQCRGWPNVPDPNWCIGRCFHTSSTSLPTTPRASSVTPKATSSTLPPVVAQALHNSTAAITNLQKNPNSQEAKIAANSTIAAALAAAAAAGDAALASVLGPAAEVAAAVAAGTASAAELEKSWEKVNLEENHAQNESKKTSERPGSTSHSSTESSVVSSTFTALSTSSATLDACSSPSDVAGRTMHLRVRGSNLESHMLQKRKGKPKGAFIDKIGQGASVCNFGLKLNWPNYLTPDGLVSISKNPTGSAGQNAAAYAAVPKWYVGLRDCTLAHGFTWQLVPSVPNPQGTMSVDHVFEKQFFKQFLTEMIKPPGTEAFDCDDFKHLFLTAGTGSIRPLQTIMDQLAALDVSRNPMINNPGLIGLDMQLNNLKGTIFNQRPGQVGATTFEDRIIALQNAAMVFGICSDSVVKNAFEETNLRFYRAFVGLDAYIVSNGVTKSSSCAPLASTWADSFEAFVPRQLGILSSEAWSWAETEAKSLQAVVDGTKDAAVKATQRQMLDELTGNPLWGATQFKFNFDLNWDKANPILFRRRLLDSRDAAACPLSKPSSLSPIPSTQAIPTKAAVPAVVPPKTTLTTQPSPSCPSPLVLASPTYTALFPVPTTEIAEFELSFDSATHATLFQPNTQWTFTEASGAPLSVYLDLWPGPPSGPLQYAQWSNENCTTFMMPVEPTGEGISSVSVSGFVHGVYGGANPPSYSVLVAGYEAGPLPCGGIQARCLQLPRVAPPAAPPPPPAQPASPVPNPVDGISNPLESLLVP